jgi:hypothetical protein
LHLKVKKFAQASTLSKEKILLHGNRRLAKQSTTLQPATIQMLQKIIVVSIKKNPTKLHLGAPDMQSTGTAAGTSLCIA